MELLELLEEKIQALIAEVEILRKDNYTLKEELSAFNELVVREKELVNELSQTKDGMEKAKGKIESLLNQVQDAISK